METEIVFCERCGVSIPEGEVARARQASGGRDLCGNCVGPSREADGDLKLYFCENCRVSIAVSDVLTGAARPEGGGYHCAVCSRSSPAERVARRTAVERELTAPDAGAPPRPAGDPLYFCDMCNSSIPAALVATGRALVQSGRTYCERCRPRAEARATRPGAGVVPVLAAALLAAAATAGVLVGWERWKQGQDGGREEAEARESMASVQRDVRRLKETGETGRAETLDRIDRASRDMDRKVESLRADLRDVRSTADRAAALAGVGDRVTRLEAQAGEIAENVKILREDVVALSERLAAVAAAAERAPAPAPPAPPAPAPPEGGPPGDPPADPGNASQPLSPDAQRCISLLKDKDAGVRFSAAIELGKLGEKGVWPALAEALRKDDDPFVRRACARSIGEIKAYDAFPALCDALLDGEEYVAVQAARVIKEMAGQDFGFKQNQAKADRKRVADRARKWWEENRDRLAPGARGE